MTGCSCVSTSCPASCTARLRPAGRSLQKRTFPKCAAGEHAGASSSGRNIELPNGTWWLDRATHKHDVVYGQNFVLQRPPRGGPGLVLSPRLHHLQLVQEGQVTDVTVLPPLASSLASVPIEEMALDLDAADYSFTSLDGGMLKLPPRLLPGTQSPAVSSCTGIILHPTSARGDEVEEADVTPAAHHPRRTQRVRFTCKLCGETTTKAVNPHAWSDGSVFARCDGCRIIHKLTDNLKLFHELSGPVFNTVSSTPHLNIPPGLPQQPGLTHHVHPFVWSMFKEEEE